MRKTLNTLLVCLSIGTIAYNIAPLFLVPKNKPLNQSIKSVHVDTSTAKDAVVGVLNEMVQTVESTLNPDASCRAPLRYAVGNVDPRFNISKDTLEADLLKSESVWEDATKEDVLQYDVLADFKINLVFDERQQKTIESKQLEQKLDTAQTLQKGISKEYDTLSNQYEKKKLQYENSLKKYERLARDYESTVQYWNDKGGAPEDVYQQLQQQRKDLDALLSEVENQRKSLNIAVNQLNILVKKEKKVVAGYNQDAETFESAYGSEKESDQGVYTGKEINIYQFSETNDLVLVLAHEFGHALGMDHVENPKSIMYYLMSQQDINHIIPSIEDMAALRGRCP